MHDIYYECDDCQSLVAEQDLETHTLLCGLIVSNDIT